MIVVFLSAAESPRYAHAMLWALRKHMPSVPVLHLTDEATPAIAGTNTVRLPNVYANPTIFRMKHLSLLEGDVLCIDTDVIIQRDLSPIFEFDFDVALTRRDYKIVDPDGRDISKIMPYNTGVMFQRNGRFWDEGFRITVDAGLDWYSDQLVAAKLDRYYNVLKLNCDNFNYKPHSLEEDVSNRYVLHYKGDARKLLDQRIDRGDFA